MISKSIQFLILTLLLVACKVEKAPLKANNELLGEEKSYLSIHDQLYTEVPSLLFFFMSVTANGTADNLIIDSIRRVEGNMKQLPNTRQESANSFQYVLLDKEESQADTFWVENPLRQRMETHTPQGKISTAEPVIKKAELSLRIPYKTWYHHLTVNGFYENDKPVLATEKPFQL